MRSLLRYFVIGWSIVTIGILIVSYGIMKKDYVQEQYEIVLSTKDPEAFEVAFSQVSANIFHYTDNEGVAHLTNKPTMLDNVDRKGIKVRSNNQVKNARIYLFLPIYAFLIWALPIAVFSLLGRLFLKRGVQE